MRTHNGYKATIRGTVSQKEADEMVALAGKLRRDVEEWLRAEHPELL